MTEFKTPIARRILIEQMSTRTRITWMLVDVNGHPIRPDTDVIRDPNVRPTCGNYSVEFSPWVNVRGKYLKQAKFKIVCDVLGERHNRSGNLRCEGYPDVVTRDDPWVRWMVRMTNLSPHHFDLAARNVGIKIPFCVDVDKLYAWQGDILSTDSAKFANEFRLRASLAKKDVFRKELSKKPRKKRKGKRK